MPLDARDLSDGHPHSTGARGPLGAVQPVRGLRSLRNILPRTAPAEFATDFQGKRSQLGLRRCFLKINNKSSCCEGHNFCCAGQVKIARLPALLNDLNFGGVHVLMEVIKGAVEVWGFPR